MKLRLSKRFFAALMAAIASVTFTSAGTATLGAAAFTFSMQQAAAAEQMESSASTETGTAMAVEASEDKEASEAEESEEIEEEEENREPDSAPAVSVGFNGIIGSSDAFDFLGGIENVGNLDNASQQQAGAQSASSSASLPSDDLGFTANAYAGSIAEALVDAAAPSVPAAIASELKLTTPAKSTSSGSSSSSSDDYSSVADASTVSGSAWNASYGSHISAPAFRPLSSKAPSNFAAANGTGSSLVIATPAGDSVPLLGATEPPAGWVFSFEHNGAIDYFTKQTSYDLVVGDGETGKITFNNALKDTPLTVEGDFKLSGPAFVIDTNGVSVAFDQPMGNYGTAFTVRDSSASKQGKIIANGAAAFKSLYVESGAMEINSQIGVLEQLRVGGIDAIITLNENGRLLLTQQVECEGGTINLYGTVDASNLPPAVAAQIGITFVGLDDKLSTSGFLGFEKDEGIDSVTWNLGKAGSTAKEINVGGNAKVLVGTSDFQILSTPDNPMPHVTLDHTDMRLWFQNGGTLSSVIDVVHKASEEAEELVSFLVTGGEVNPEDGERGDLTEIHVDDQMFAENIIYVARNAGTYIQLIGEDSGQIWAPYSTKGSVGQLKCLDGSYTQITSFYHQDNPVTDAAIIGQNVVIKAVRSDDPYQAVYDTMWCENPTFSPANMIVESTSAGTIYADIKPYFGYFDGVDYWEYDPSQSKYYRLGTYDIKGELTVADGFVMDFSIGEGAAMWTYTTIDGVQNELYAHLVVSNAGGAIKLGNGSEFLASTIDNATAALTGDLTNLDTARNTLTPEDRNTVNGTLTISSEGQATLTYTGADTSEEGGDIRSNYTTRNQKFKITNATLTVSDYAPVYDEEWPLYVRTYSDTTVSNELSGSSVINDKAESNGSLTLDNTNAPDVDLNLVYAKEGDIIITHKDEVTADTVQIGAGRMVSVENLDQATKLNVSSLLLAEGFKGEDEDHPSYSKIDAELHLSPSATLNVAAADGVGGIDMMGNEVVFDIDYGETALTLSPGDYSQAWAMEKGGKYDLFHNVSAFTMYFDSFPMTDPILEEYEIDASVFFSNLEEGCFLLCYSGADISGGHGENVGTIYLYSMVPEPTTGTLSLLALAALAARRRRKG